MFKSIAFGGGGVRGGLHVGALAALESVQGHLTFPDGIYGSSIGAIIATAVAFGLKSAQIRDMFENHFDLDKIVPPMRMAAVVELPTKKGLFEMDFMEQGLLAAFDSQGIDLRGKVIADSPQKLLIIASNMTTCNTSVFTGKVPVLKAIRCSCCLPGVFYPQILYNQVYLDGGVFIDNVSEVAGSESLVFHISAAPSPIFPSDVETMKLSSFLYGIYRGMRLSKIAPNVLWLQNSSVTVMQDITPADKKQLYDEGYSQALRFLTKRGAKKIE
jgi:NTE family protein